MSITRVRAHRPAGVAQAIIIMLLTLMQLSGAHAQGRTFPPVDEASRDSSLVEFRQRLIDAVVRRDAEYVVSQASTDISLSHGGHAGRDDFMGFLTLSESDLSEEYRHEAKSRREAYWDALEDVLRMGGRFTADGTFEAPYYASAPLGENDDPFSTWYVIGADVPLLDRPNNYGNVVATLDYHIVTALEESEGSDFLKVQVADDVTGYVAASYLRSPAGTTAQIEKRGGRWQLTGFLGGD